MPERLSKPVGDLLAEPHLSPISFEDLDGFDNADLRPAWRAFRLSCSAMLDRRPELRPGRPADERLLAVARLSLQQPSLLTSDEIRAFFKLRFEPHATGPDRAMGEQGRATPPDGSAFFTAYYRPEVRASKARTDGFREALLARPDDLVSLHAGGSPDLPTGYSAGRRMADGRLQIYPSRAEIDSGLLGTRARPLAYVPDAIEAFMIQVQGSARLVFDDGEMADLTYAGRNGHPYVSIGKALIERGEISSSDMSLDRLKGWVRAQGQEIGQRGRELLHLNPSFVFFSSSASAVGLCGPVGAAGVRLSEHASIAIDRTLWVYGLPFWIEADISWQGAKVEPYRRLMIAQDTGSAIVGSARADLYFGSGESAGRMAGGIRHHGRMVALLPRIAS